MSRGSAEDGGREDGPPPIGDYAFLSDCTSAALVDRAGSVDWWCVPRFDSPSVFGRLLDPAAGHWTMAPAGAFESSREYVEDSLVLRTVFRTATGEVELTDALAFAPGARGHQIGVASPHVLLRRVTGISGVVDVRSVAAGLATPYPPPRVMGTWRNVTTPAGGAK